MELLILNSFCCFPAITLRCVIPRSTTTLSGHNYFIGKMPVTFHTWNTYHATSTPHQRGYTNYLIGELILCLYVLCHIHMEPVVVDQATILPGGNHNVRFNSINFTHIERIYTMYKIIKYITS